MVLYHRNPSRLETSRASSPQRFSFPDWKYVYIFWSFRSDFLIYDSFLLYHLDAISELIKRVPDFYTAAPESVRERVALRYLEECASRGMVDAKNISGATVDISQSTEDFLSQNLKRVHESNPFPVFSMFSPLDAKYYSISNLDLILRAICD